MRRLLSSTILGGALAFTALAGVQQASAGVFYDLSPNSDWAVSKIRPKSSSSKPYCALARRFTNDVVLTFARNQSNQTSIAIDFQKTRLDRDQFYTVRLHAGKGETREFNLQPVSDAAMVVKVGNDRAFMDALKRSGTMMANIEGYQYSFNISDFSAGESRMGSCLANLVEPAAGGFDEPIRGSNNSYDASPLTPVADTKELLSAPSSDTGYTSKISDSEADMAREIEALRVDNDKLRAALSKQRKTFEDQYMSQSRDSSAMIELSEKVQLLEVENNELRLKVADMATSQTQNTAMPVKAAQCEPEVVKDPAVMRQLDSLRDANEKLQFELKQAKARMAAGEHEVTQTGAADKQIIQELNSRVSYLEQENATLKAQLNSTMRTQAAKSDDGAKIGALQSSIDAMQIENTKLKTRIRQQELELANIDSRKQKQAAVSDLQKRVNVLLAENEKLSNTIEAMDSSGDTVAAGMPFLASKVNMLETQLTDVRRERDSLLSKIDQMNAGREDQLIDISSGNWNLEKATQRYNEAEREIQRLGLQLEQERSSCNTEKRDIEYMLFDPSIATKEQIVHLNSAEEKAAKAQALLGAQRSGYETKISLLRHKVEGLQGDVNVLQGKLEVAESEYQKGIDGYKKKLAARASEKNEKIAGYQAQIKSLQTALAAKESELVAQVQSLKDELAAKESELVAQNNTIEVLKNKQGDMVTASADLEKLKRDRDYLVEKAAKLEQANARLKAVEQKFAALQEKSRDAELSAAMAQEAAERMNIVEAAAGGHEQASGRIERESLPSPIVKSRDVGEVGISPKSVDSYKNTMAAQAIDKATQAGIEILSANSTMTGVRKYLDMAGIKADGGIKKTDGQKNFVTYSWETKGMYGSAEQTMMGGKRGYDGMVRAYLSKTEARCSGDFAASPASDAVVDGIHVGSYEIACIGDDISASASVVFIEEHGQFTTIAHEAELDYMDYAMDIRDKIVSSFDKTKVAAR